MQTNKAFNTRKYPSLYRTQTDCRRRRKPHSEILPVVHAERLRTLQWNTVENSSEKILILE